LGCTLRAKTIYKTNVSPDERRKKELRQSIGLHLKCPDWTYSKGIFQPFA